MNDQRINELLRDTPSYTPSYTRADYDRDLADVTTQFAALGYTLDEAAAKVRAHDYYHGEPFDVPAERWIMLCAFDGVMREHEK